MRAWLTGFAAVAALNTPALADCKEEVAAAYAKQRSAGSFRMVTDMISGQGPVEMSIDYVLPNRMHQRVKTKIDNKTTETILVFNQAWTQGGEGWSPIPAEMAAEISKQMQETVVDPPESELTYACLGLVSVEGKEYRAFRLEEDKSKPLKGAPQADPPERILYVDPATGLPAINTATLKDRPDRPFFKAQYTYPTDIKIEPPEVPKKP